MRNLTILFLLAFFALPTFGAGTKVSSKAVDLPQNIEALLSRKDTKNSKRWVVVHTKDGKKHRGHFQPFITGAQVLELRDSTLPKPGKTDKPTVTRKAIPLSDITKVSVRRQRSKWFAIVPTAAFGVTIGGALLVSDGIVNAGVIAYIGSAPVGLTALILPTKHTVLVEP